MFQFSPGVLLLLCGAGCLMVCWVFGVAVVCGWVLLLVCVLFVLVGCLVVWLCPRFCCSWCVVGCVALSAFLLLVLLWVARPGVGCSWLFFVVVGSAPLFLVRHDQARLWSCSWFNAECHSGWVAVCGFCSWRFMGVCLGVLSCSSRCLRTRRFCLVCVWFGFLLPVVFRLVLVSLVLLFLSALLLLFLGFVSCLARFSWFVLFVFLRLVVCRVLPCFGLLRCVSWFLWVML